MEIYLKLNKDLIKNNGSTLLKLHNNSISTLVTTTYPNYNWLLWKFHDDPPGLWNNDKNIHQYMDWLGQKLNIKQMEDWYQLSSEVLSFHDNYSILFFIFYFYFYSFLFFYIIIIFYLFYIIIF